MKENSVIIIDDSLVDRKMIKWLLEEKINAIRIYEKDNSKDVIETIINKNIKACILNIEMENTDGYQIIENIKRIKETKDIPIIVCFEKMNIKSVEKVLELGASDYFLKPLSEEMVKIALPLKVKNAIDLYKSRMEINYLSYHDKLTGLYNRRYVDFMLDKLNKKNKLPAGLIIGDINGLKLTNDVFGHDTGDQIIVNISKILQSVCLNNCMLARWGGDEFIIIQCNTTKNEIKILKKRILDRIRCFNKEKRFQIEVSISLGSSIIEKVDFNIHKVIKLADDNMYKEKLIKSREYRNLIVNSLKEKLIIRSYETKDHIERMRELCRKIASNVNLCNKEVELLDRLAILHDIGKVAIREDVLLKEEEVKKHSEIGYRITKEAPEYSDIAEYILSHHERWDGSGYPQGLKEQQIPTISRILSIVHEYEDMTNKKDKHKIEVLKSLKERAGSQFDPELVKVIEDIV